jgi:hypothetical protein
MSSHKSWYSGLGLRSHTLCIPYERVWLLGASFKGQNCFKKEKLQDYLLCDTLEYFCFNLSIHSFSNLLIVDIFIIPLKVLDVLFYINYILTCIPLFFTGLSVCKIKWTMPPLGSKDNKTLILKATVSQHPPVHHPLDAHLLLSCGWINIWFHPGNQFFQK